MRALARSRNGLCLSLLGAFGVALLAGCSGTPSPFAIEEPIGVRTGVFKSGELPEGREATDGTVGGPRITNFENANAIVQWGQAGKLLEGRATPDTYAIAVRLAGAGSGYFLVPVGAVDPTANGDRVWSMTLDFASDLPTGLGALEMAAIDEQGLAGPLTEVRLCIVSGLPGGNSACDPTVKVPEAVIALTWDTDVDLDLVLLSSTGQVVDWQHPSSNTEDAAAEGTALLTRNSNAGCALDYHNREEVVWQTLPPAGTWLVYANLFDACGQLSVNYQVTVFRRDGDLLVERSRVRGILDVVSANGGASEGTVPGTFALEVRLP